MNGMKRLHLCLMMVIALCGMSQPAWADTPTAPNDPLAVPAPGSGHPLSNAFSRALRSAVSQSSPEKSLAMLSQQQGNLAAPVKSADLAALNAAPSSDSNGIYVSDNFVVKNGKIYLCARTDRRCETGDDHFVPISNEFFQWLYQDKSVTYGEVLLQNGMGSYRVTNLQVKLNYHRDNTASNKDPVQ